MVGTRARTECGAWRLHPQPAIGTQLHRVGLEGHAEPAGHHLDEDGNGCGVLGEFLSGIEGKANEAELVVAVQHLAERAVLRDLQLFCQDPR